ncbi:hypothetical protein SPBR_01154 [Sporothrix brasiliensis 5110]|uniref:Dolichyl-diphosphooligosaccharide-protein glycosyltransferase subunit OST5 n=1 Tax=Sporothrix brasiliensis 5110 TaxID=1398154 RepID=A0A0C2IYH4_9PEZI|nr:uncharacterized protein SPBR_01154 [Sporothrix brasiliensis 5110]KIH90047.1 hypothetical protein SPBR_01154 [Sporothrix brasiliensis 5110]
MDSSLHELWQTASGSPFNPTIGKGSQFLVGFSLLVLGLGLTGSFLLNRTLASISYLGLPASLAVAYVSST